MGKIGDAQTYEDAYIIARAWEINNNLPKGTITGDLKSHVKKHDDGWEVRFEVWE